MFEPEDFDGICKDIYNEWKKPRVGVQERPRKHNIRACLFTVLGILSTGMTSLNMEGLAAMPASLINVEFERVLKILDKEYEGELFLLSEEEKEYCIGAATSDPYIIYYVDGCDFPLQIAKHKWMYLTTKKNIKSRTAIRAQILIDSFWGFFRGVEIDCAGLTNDQGMLTNSVWNKAPGILTKVRESVGGDEGYWETKFISVTKPVNKTDLEADPGRKYFNKKFNYDRGLIEHTFAILKEKFRIFDLPWLRHRNLFPLALRVCLKLMNKWWRLDENNPPGLKRRIAQIKKI